MYINTDENMLFEWDAMSWRAHKIISIHRFIRSKCVHVQRFIWIYRVLNWIRILFQRTEKRNQNPNTGLHFSLLRKIIILLYRLLAMKGVYFFRIRKMNSIWFFSFEIKRFFFCLFTEFIRTRYVFFFHIACLYEFVQVGPSFCHTREYLIGLGYHWTLIFESNLKPFDTHLIQCDVLYISAYTPTQFIPFRLALSVFR